MSALWHPFTQMQEFPREDPPPPRIAAAEGNWLIADDGSRYLDANCGYWCLALGCRPAGVEAAIRQQLDRFSHSTLLGLSHQPAEALAERLAALAGAPFNHVFFCDSGSEAVEAALKMAYQFHVLNGHPERCEFMALGDAYHGDTLGAVALGGIELFHATFKPLLFNVRRTGAPHCYRCPWGKRPETCALECAAEMERALATHAPKLAALVVEPYVLGPGGIIPQPPQYLERIVRAARQHGVLVVFDEVAAGMGRLGRLFTFEQLPPELRPDLVCLAKGLTAGLLPLSAVLAAETVYNAFLGTIAERKTFFHGHTFTGSALGCAAALAALEVLAAPGFMEKLRDETIPRFWEALAPLRDLPHAGDLRGRGLMAGIELVKDKATREAFPFERRSGHRAVLAARRRGVNTRAVGDVVLAVPPLTITPDEIDLLARVLRESIEAAGAGDK